MMTRLTCAGMLIACALLSGGRSHAAGCDPIGNIQFICDVQAPEDFAIVPGSDWLLTSGNRPGQGAIRALHPAQKKIVTVFPAATVKAAHDAKAFPGCPRPINLGDDAEKKAFAACIYGRNRRADCVWSSCTMVRGNRLRHSTWIRRPIRRR